MLGKNKEKSERMGNRETSMIRIITIARVEQVESGEYLGRMLKSPSGTIASSLGMFVSVGVNYSDIFIIGPTDIY